MQQCLGFTAAAAMLVGISAALLWPRVGIALLWSAAGISVLLPAAATAISKLDPQVLRHIPRQTSDQLALLAGLVGIGAIFQWRTNSTVPAAQSGSPSPGFRRKEKVQGKSRSRLEVIKMSLQTLAMVSQTIKNSTAFFSDVPTTWPQQHDLLAWCRQMTPGVAAGLIIVGIIYLLFGYQIFKVVVLLNAAVIGAYFGATSARKATPPRSAKSSSPSPPPPSPGPP